MYTIHIIYINICKFSIFMYGRSVYKFVLIYDNAKLKNNCVTIYMFYNLPKIIVAYPIYSLPTPKNHVRPTCLQRISAL